MIKEVSIFDYEEKIKLNNSEEVMEELKKLNGVSIKKFLSEVRKTYKLMTSTPLWYGFSEKLMSEYNLKSKDQYAIIKGKYKEGNIWFPKTQETKFKMYNFRCIPQSRAYGNYICMDISVINNIVEINDIFITS